MDKETLQLTLCQLIKVSDTSRKNYSVYSDKKKIKFHKEIEQLLSDIKQSDFNSFTKDDRLLHKELFQILFAWLEFLDNSTLNNIPYEIVRCLEAVLEDWLEPANRQKFMIVTTLQSHASFGFIDWDLRAVVPYVKGKYNRDITNPLVPINLPKYVVHDYLSNVTLYHELGHFIDQHFKISARIINSNPLYSRMPRAQKLKEYYHMMEFFADIFAAQYIGDKCSLYLNYIAHDDPESDTHPATSRRVDLVNSFLKKKSDVIIDILKDATKKITKIDLAPKKYKVIRTNDFEDFLPIEVVDKHQLHYLYIIGWNTWYHHKGILRSKFKDPPETYRIINNLIEKSISNFIVTEKWQGSSSKI